MKKYCRKLLQLFALYNCKLEGKLLSFKKYLTNCIRVFVTESKLVVRRSV